MYSAEYAYQFKLYLSAEDIPYYTYIEFTSWIDLKAKIPNWDTIQALKIGGYIMPCTALPEEPGYWPRDLIDLNLESNNLVKLPEHVGYWPDSLENLHLSYNPDLVALPNIPGYLPPKLRILYLNNTGLTTLPDIAGYWPKYLHSLYLYDCPKLCIFPENLTECVNMLHFSYIGCPVAIDNIPLSVRQWLDNINFIARCIYIETSSNIEDYVVRSRLY